MLTKILTGTWVVGNKEGKVRHMSTENLSYKNSTHLGEYVS